MLRVQQFARRDGRADEGYAMLLVSIVSILLFALLSASMTLSNLARAKTNAYVDGQSSFYVAEAGLNARASDFAKLANGYSGVSGVTVPNKDVRALTPCYNIAIPTTGRGATTATGTDDFECRNYGFKSSNNAAQVASGTGISLNSGVDNQFIAYTAIADLTKYNNGIPDYKAIPSGDAYAGLNASEYKYRIFAAAKKPITLPTNSLPNYTAAQKAAINRCNQGAALQAGDTAICNTYNTAYATATAGGVTAQSLASGGSNVSLSADFTVRAIPLFQFGIFYDGDLELNSTSAMQINGWVHSNGNIYVQPAGVSGDPDSVTTFLDHVTAAGSIYNRVDAFGVNRTGITRVLLTGTDYTCATGCGQFTPFSTSITDKLTTAQINAINTIGTVQYDRVQDSTKGALALRTPPSSSTRKRNYATNQIGTYFAQADLRLEMVPDRDVTSKPANGRWLRNQAIIPFNFTAITTGGTGTCTTTTPTAGTDPVNTYVDPTREKLGTRHCNVFTKGQLQSLRQPVLVLTSIKQTDATLKAREDLTLGKPTATSTPAFPTLPSWTLSTTANTLAVKKKIARALQIALVSTPKPVPFEKLDTRFDDPVYVISTNALYADLNPFQSGFSTLIGGIAELSALDRFNLLATTPNQIAALADAWFLPAPIQRVEKNNTDTTEVTANLRSSGFYDGREQRWITMLQTNLASLSVWNRDGVFVEPSTNITDLTQPYQTNNAKQLIAFNDAIAATPSTNITDGLAFDRAPADATKPVGSLQYLGLGSNDTTEGGLVFHATVNDDLNGDGTLDATNDVTIDSTVLYKKNPDGTDYIDTSLPASVTDRRVIIDKLRTYPGTGTTDTRKSPFAFAFNGGDYLPTAMMLSSDQAIYVQGNFNNNGAAQSATAANTPSSDRLPAAIVADTITVLSNQCVSLTNSIGSNQLGVHLGQLKCGIPPTINGTPSTYYDPVTSPMAINAAFLSNTQVSNGNLGTGRYDGVAANKSYSGGANNYIRLLEDWYNSGTPYALNYYGSLISVGTPLEYSGVYKPGGIDPDTPGDTAYYNVPFRNFNFDINFKDVLKLPPLTPKVTYTMQNNFSRNF